MLLIPPRIIRGFTRVELLIVVFVIALLFIVLAPELTKRFSKASRIKCSSNLKQIALSFKMYAGDHDQKFPQFDYSDSLAANPTTQRPLPVWQYFSALSNELGSTKILMCPDDVIRQPNVAQIFGVTDTTNNLIGLLSASNSAVSYFVGLNAEETKPNMVLAGDRNLAPRRNTALYISTNGAAVDVSTNAVWQTFPQEPFHKDGGFYALADGSVQQASTARLQDTLRLARDSYGTNANRFLFPQ